MKNKSIINAVLAEVYIIAIVSLINFGFKPMGENGDPETIIIPIMMLSLLVLSVSVMGYLFFSEPIQLYLEGQKKDAVKSFLTTTGTFAVITIIVVLIFFLGV